MSCSHDNMITMTVYRAANSDSEYGRKLLNANAADAAGVLAYLHAEVTPFDMGSCKGYDNPETGTTAWERKYGIDVVNKFEVEICNPGISQMPDASGCQAAGYTADALAWAQVGFFSMEAGKCSEPVRDDCAAMLETCGPVVGTQRQDNPRHGYYGWVDEAVTVGQPGVDDAIAGQWISFMEEGWCGDDHEGGPTGDVDCVYTFKYTDSVAIDDLVDSWNDNNPSAVSEDDYISDYETFCKAAWDGLDPQKVGAVPNFYEMARKMDAGGLDPIVNCPDADDDNTLESVAFWNNMCDTSLCQKRTDFLEAWDFGPVDNDDGDNDDGNGPSGGGGSAGVIIGVVGALVVVGAAAAFLVHRHKKQGKADGAQDPLVVNEGGQGEYQHF